MRRTLFVLYALLTQSVGAVAAKGYTFAVKHEHFWGAATGELRISESGIAFESETDRDHSREWDYTEIQELKVAGPTRLRILTYEDVWWKLNSDRRVDFVLTDEEITPEVIAFLRRHLTTPLVTTLLPTGNQLLYSLPVKHKHGLGGGCEGRLLFTEEGLYYRAKKTRHSRFWSFKEIESLGQTSPFNLRVTVREHTRFGSQRSFQFLLKGALPDEISDLLWRKVFEPESWLVGSKPE